VKVPDDRPPDWANSLVKWALTTPGIERIVGKALALLSFEGHKTGRHYTIPVSYQRDGDVVTVITKRQRKWWHNFETPMKAELRLAGRSYAGIAAVERDEAGVLDFMTKFLETRPIDAKAYGLSRDLSREKIALIIPHVVVIRITIEPGGGSDREVLTAHSQT
jgi:hypothetical protein